MQFFIPRQSLGIYFVRIETQTRQESLRESHVKVYRNTRKCTNLCGSIFANCMSLVICKNNVKHSMSLSPRLETSARSQCTTKKTVFVKRKEKKEEKENRLVGKWIDRIRGIASSKRRRSLRTRSNDTTEECDLC